MSTYTVPSFRLKFRSQGADASEFESHPPTPGVHGSISFLYQRRSKTAEERWGIYFAGALRGYAPDREAAKRRARELAPQVAEEAAARIAARKAEEQRIREEEAARMAEGKVLVERCAKLAPCLGPRAGMNDPILLDALRDGLPLVLDALECAQDLVDGVLRDGGVELAAKLARLRKAKP